jgi:hypothetical protein
MRRLLFVSFALWASCTPFSCIDSEPVDCSLAGPGCGDAGVGDMPPVVQCETSSKCNDTTPFCDLTSHECTVCTPEEDGGIADGGESAVASVCTHTPDKTHCGPAGSCVQCINKYDCSNQACTNNVCGPCTSNAECASGICDLSASIDAGASGACVTPSSIYYIDNANGACTGTHTGEQTDPFCQITSIVSVTHLRSYALVTGSAVQYDAVTIPANIAEPELTIVGPGRNATVTANVITDNRASFSFTPDSSTTTDFTLNLVGLTMIKLTMPASMIPTYGLLVQNTTLNKVFASVSDSEITGASTAGISVSGTSLKVSSSVVSSNGVGVSFTAGAPLLKATASFDRVLLSANAGGGVSVDGPYTATNCIFAGNGTSSPGGPAFKTTGPASSTNLFAYNTLYNNGAPNTAGAVQCLSGQTLFGSIFLLNNTMSGSQVSASCQVIDSYSTSDSNEIGIIDTTGINNNGIPTYVLTPAGTNCCVDKILKMNDLSTLPTTDHDYFGDFRPNGLGYDYGADEFH